MVTQEVMVAGMPAAMPTNAADAAVPEVGLLEAAQFQVAAAPAESVLDEPALLVGSALGESA